MRLLFIRVRESPETLAEAAEGMETVVGTATGLELLSSTIFGETTFGSSCRPLLRLASRLCHRPSHNYHLRGKASSPPGLALPVRGALILASGSVTRSTNGNRMKGFLSAFA